MKALVLGRQKRCRTKKICQVNSLRAKSALTLSYIVDYDK